MQKRFILSIVSSLIILMTGVMTVQAGFTTEVDSASASSDCDIVSGSWSHPFGDYTIVTISPDGGGAPLHSQRFDNNSGTFNFDLSPNLADGTIIRVEIEVFEERRLSIGKDILYKRDSSVEGLPPPVARSRFDVTCSKTAEIMVVVPQAEAIRYLCADGRLTYTLCDPLVVYNVVSSDGVGLIMYTSSRDNAGLGEFKLEIPAETFASLPANPDVNCTIASSDDGTVVVYLLSTGEIQINTGPDGEGKVFSYIFADLVTPPTSINSFISEGTPEILASC